jgi:hypothetical protein
MRAEWQGFLFLYLLYQIMVIQINDSQEFGPDNQITNGLHAGPTYNKSAKEIISFSHNSILTSNTLHKQKTNNYSDVENIILS